MKLLRAFLLLLNTLMFCCPLTGQNTYDNYSGFSSGVPTFNPLYSTSSYAGEYQMHLRLDPADEFYNHWASLANADLTSPVHPLSLSYKIELVSFPFTPEHSSTPDYLNRPFNTLDNSIYNVTTNKWENRINRIYKGVHDNIGGSTISTVSINDETTLISVEYLEGYNTLDPLKIIFPHSVLKHTIYIHCDAVAATPPMDSIVFVIDHTRGRMRSYPFADNYNSGANPTAYDILLTANYFYGSDPSNGIEFWNPNNPQTTINYSAPLPFDGRGCNLLSASSIHPTPFSLASFQLLNSVGTFPAGYGLGVTPGVQHTYEIDKPIDLTIINPGEKTIYNPSELSIDLATPDNTTGIYTQIFPSGYTFKTVSGRYPSAPEVFAADPNSLHRHKEQIPVPTTLNFDDVGPNDGIFSYYYVRSGTTLKIESCVSIYDTKIIVEPGASLIYDAAKTYGNYIIENNGTVNNHSSTTSASCENDCYQIENYDDHWFNPTVNSDQTWSGSFSPFDFDGDGIIRIAGQLRVSAGKTLTITDGLRFEFGETGGIFIERGAKLIVNAHPSNPCVFTSAEFCKTGMWKGIEVWGDRTKVQTDPSQGLVSLTNAKLSNARDGIITSGPAWGYEGGIIQCTNVEFTNNRKSVGFSSYPSTDNNLSFFKSCTFFTTDYLNDPTYLTSDGRRHAGGGQVTMWEVKNVLFSNCHFENKAKKADGITALFDTDTRSMGIFSIDADVRLLKSTTSPVNNVFIGYSDAVWCINTIPTTFQQIEGTNFQNNVRGITIEGGRYTLIEENIIEVPKHDPNFAISGKPLVEGYNKPTGIYMIGTKDFTIYNNMITNYGPLFTSALPQEYNYGIVVNNCSGSSGSLTKDGDGTGYVYKNTISNVNIGLQNELDNKGLPGYGLTYSCNNFSNRINSDVTVVSKDVANPALLREQGLCASTETQTGNTYIVGCVGNQKLEFDGTAVYYDTNPPSGIPAPFIYRDQNLSSYMLNCTNMTFSGCGGLALPNPCDDIPWFCGVPCLSQAFVNAQTAAKNARDQYSLLVDGGSTNNLLSAINSNMSAGSLKSLLISKSPYLSDGVLIATLNRQDLPPYGHLQQIFIANSPITAPVLAELQGTGLPSGILNAIMDAQTGVSPRREKESIIDYYAYKENLARTILIQEYLKTNDLEGLKQLTATNLTLNGLFRHAEVLIRKGEYSGALSTMTKITALETPNISDRNKLYSITLELASAKKNWLDLTPNQQSVIEQIYFNNPNQAIDARAVLSFSKGLQYERYPYDFESTRMTSANLDGPQEEAETSGLTIYPNPANESANIEINLKGVEAGELSIYNLLGAEVARLTVYNQQKVTLDTRSFNNGIYLLVLKSGSGYQEKQKLIISR